MLSDLNGRAYWTLGAIFNDLNRAEYMKDVGTVLRNAYRMKWFRNLLDSEGNG